jgi:hypothetical protein
MAEKTLKPESEQKNNRDRIESRDDWSRRALFAPTLDRNPISKRFGFRSCIDIELSNIFLFCVDMRGR